MEIKLTFKSNNRTLVIGNDTSYKLVNIEGIDSGSLELNTVSNAQFDGSVVVSKRIQNRPISITVDYKGTNSQEIERQNLISFFNPKNRGLLIVNYGEIERAIEYEVEGFNCKLNSVFDTVSFTVDFMCPNPYWRDIVESKINIAMWRGMFHFPLIMPGNIVPHSGTDSTWKDLSGNLNNGLLTGFNFDATSGWTTDGLKFDSDSYVTLPSLELQEGTIQVNNQVVTFDKDVDYRTTSANSNIVSLDTTVDGVMDVEVGGNTLQNLFKPSTTIGGSVADGYWYCLNTHPITDLSGKTITLVNPTTREIQYGIRDLANVAIRDEVIQPFSKKVITLEANRKVHAVVGNVSKGWTDTNKTELKGMILEGDWTNKEIPYFEGIRSVGEVNFLDNKYIGKNLFNGSVVFGAVLIENGNIGANSLRMTTELIPVKPNTSYSLSGHGSYTLSWITFYDINKNYLGQVLDVGYKAGNVKLLTPNNAYYCRQCFQKSTTIVQSDLDYISNNFQLEEGNMVTSYEKYYEGCKIESVSIGKNLFNINGITKGIPQEMSIKDEKIIISNKYNCEINDNSFIEKLVRSLKPNTTYKFSANIQGSAIQGVTGRIALVTQDNKPFLINVGGILGKVNYSFTTPSSLNEYIKFWIYGNDSTVITYSDIQIEEGEVSTTYESYKEHRQTISLTNPLRGLPNNVRDIVDFEKGVVVKNVGKIVLNGGENWSTDNNLINTVQFNSPISNGFKPNQDSSTVFLNDKFIQRKVYNQDIEGSFWNQSGLIWIRIYKSKLVSYGFIDGDLQTYSSAFKAWLQANPITVYYQLATPTIESLAQGLKLKSFSNGTLQVNTLIPPYLTANYPITLGGSLASNVSRLDLSNPLITDLVKNYRVYNKILTTEEINLANTVNYLKGPALLVDLNSSYKELNKTGIIMGLREPSLIVNALNAGNVESGMIIEFKALGTLTNPSILNVETQEFFKVNKSMVAGEIITVNTNVGAKKVIRNLNGVETNILNLIDLDSTFLQLNVGDNLLRYDADTNLNNLEINIYYNPFYLGV